jgi:penicillin amidase
MLIQALLVALIVQGPAAEPKTLSLTYRGEAVKVVRDTYGIPHVTAKTLTAACYGNGYAIAEDRIAQMDLNRRAARGEMAELVGPSALAADRETRIDGYSEAEREAQFARLPDELRGMIQAYTDGVNAYLKEAQASGRRRMAANYPGAQDGLDLSTLRPWKVTDTVAIGQMMARRFGGDEGGELRNQLILTFLKNAQKNDAYRLFNDALWRNDPASPTTIPPGEDGRKWPGKPHWADPTGKLIAESATPAALQRAAEIVSQKERLALAERMGLMTKWGSYCMAVSAAKSATGNAMLVGGPQMGFRTPQIAHEVHLKTDDVDVIGMGFPGIPGVLIGHNAYLAWSTTTGVNDQTDIFVETLHPTDSKQYRLKGAWRTMEERTETIAVRGGEPVQVVCLRTVHGPVVQVDEKARKAYARKASYWDRELETFEAVAAMARARNVADFGKACSLIPTSHNWFCATQNGDIGFWFCGLTPIRADGIDPRLPTPGEGDHEWRGFLPFAQMPQIINPKQGFVANWNNKPAVWWDNRDTPVWGEVFHNGRIAQLLAAKPRLTTQDLRDVIVDIGTYDYNAHVLLPVLRAALVQRIMLPGAQLTESGRKAADYLLNWDCHAKDGSVAKTIFDAWLEEVREDLFGKPFGFIKLQGQGMFAMAMQPSLIVHVLKDKRSSVPVQYAYLKGRHPNVVMLQALNRAVEKLAKQRGPEISLWRHTRGTINFSPLPPIPSTDRGTYIQIVECAKPRVRGVSILPPGQSECTDSPHFGDQRELAGWLFFKEMQTDAAAGGGGGR